jgi:hypothetical protein
MTMPSDFEPLPEDDDFADEHASETVDRAFDVDSDVNQENGPR